MKKATPPSKTKTPARTGSRATSKPSDDQPETAKRYRGLGWCLLCIDKQLADRLGPKRTNAILDQLGKHVLRLVYQDHTAVVNVDVVIDAEIE